MNKSDKFIRKATVKPTQKSPSPNKMK